MFSFNKNSISLKRHMLQSQATVQDDSIRYHPETPSFSLSLSLSFCSGFSRMQLGKGMLVKRGEQRQERGMQS